MAATTAVLELPNRRVVPESGPDLALKNQLAETPGRMVRGFVQLVRTPGVEERAALAAAKIRLGRYLGGTFYEAEFLPGRSLESVRSVVLWAGLLKVEDKIEPTLWRDEISAWARTRSGRVKILVAFYDGTTAEEARRILSGVDPSARVHGSGNEWVAELTRDDVRAIASEDAVRWIEQGPPPWMPLGSSL